MNYWEQINERLVELYTLLKWGMITKNEFNELRQNLAKGLLK